MMKQALSSPYIVCHTFPKIPQVTHKVSGSHTLHVKDFLISCGLLTKMKRHLFISSQEIERNRKKSRKTLFKIIDSFFEIIIL